MLKNKVFWRCFIWGFCLGILVVMVTADIFRSLVPFWVTGDGAFAVVVITNLGRGYPSRAGNISVSDASFIIEPVQRPKLAGLSAGYFASAFVLCAIMLGLWLRR